MALFAITVICLAIMAFTRSFWMIVVLGGMVPILVVIQVLAVLRGREEPIEHEEEEWYEEY